MPNVLEIGDTVLFNDFFDDKLGETPFKSGCKIYINPFLQTSNAGAEEGDIAYARTRGATIRYVTDFTAPNPITNLSIGNVYGTAIQLNFTAPTGSLNTIDFYEVWVNGRYYQDITGSGQYITGLTPSTVYNIEVKPTDIYYNKSTSNIVTQTTSDGAITDLSIGNIYATALQLNWNSGVYLATGYKVYLDGVYYQTISQSGSYITGLTPNTSYNITVRGVDAILGEMPTSNIVTQATSANTLPSGGEAETATYINRINSDGGVVADIPMIDGLFKNLIANSLQSNLLFWYNNLGGVKKDASNFVEKLYSFTNANTDIIQLTQANKPLYTITGINFDATDEMAKTLATSIVAPTFTIMFKVKAVPVNYYPTIAFQSWDAFIMHSSSGGLIYAGNKVSQRFKLAAGSFLNNITATYTFTYNSTTKIAKIYRDTTLLGSMTQTDPIDRTAILMDARNGTFYDAKMFNKDLSLTEITNII